MFLSPTIFIFAAILSLEKIVKVLLAAVQGKKKLRSFHNEGNL
jgi:hypothetical protein